MPPDDRTLIKRFVRWLVQKSLSPREWIPDAFDWSVDHVKPLFLFAGAFCILLIIVAARLGGLDVLYFLPVREEFHANYVPAAAEWITLAQKDQRCLRRAINAHRDYVIQSLIQYVEYGEPTDTISRTVRERIFYDVIPITPVAGSRSFDEWYSESKPDSTVKYWHGPYDEVAPNPSTEEQYAVSYAAKKGARTTIETGVNVSYRLPFPDSRRGPFNDADLDASEDYWTYKNTDDVICSLTLVVESPSITLTPHDTYHVSTRSAGGGADAVGPRQFRDARRWRAGLHDTGNVV